MIYFNIIFIINLLAFRYNKNVFKIKKKDDFGPSFENTLRVLEACVASQY